jgi:peptide/nickel transport system permease protein
MSARRGPRAALVVLAVWVLLGVAARFLPLGPNTVDLPLVLAPPGEGGWLGRDELGRPVADRLLLGAGTSLQVALSVVAVAGVLGTLVGTLAAYRGGWVDRLLTAVVDVFMAFPGLLLAIALAGVLGPGLDNLVIALAAVGWVGYARLARAQALSLRHREHVLAAVALGSGTARIVVRHLLPLMAGPLVVEATFGLASAVVAEAGLSFLGIGVQPPDASWGTMIREGVRYVLVAPHLVLAPGLALSAVVLAVNLAGDWLRDRIDVRAAAATARRRT